jgi:glycyl-radical enzyme activating protein
MAITGTIFEIHRFSLNDGPGIRTTIFLKGCPMQCSWCHNHESQNAERQLYFDPGTCAKCGNCVDVCPTNVHSISNEAHLINYDRCNLSGKCVEVCPEDALKIIGQEMTIEDVLAEVEKDKSYYERSQGGVTISGGEPMQQFAFLLELTRELKRKNINVCLDTSGYASKKLFRQIAPFIDLFHFDIKIFDDQAHQIHTGVKNNMIMQNLDILAREEKQIVLRCPIIPGVNDKKAHFLQLAALVSKYPSIVKIDLLPYHKMGLKKACNILTDKNPVVFDVPDEAQKERWKNWVSEKVCIPVSIGA